MLLSSSLENPTEGPLFDEGDPHSDARGRPEENDSSLPNSVEIRRTFRVQPLRHRTLRRRRLEQLRQGAHSRRLALRPRTALRPACQADRTAPQSSPRHHVEFSYRIWQERPTRSTPAYTGASYHREIRYPEHAPRAARYATAAMDPQGVHRDGRPRVYRPRGEGRPFRGTCGTCGSATAGRPS